MSGRATPLAACTMALLLGLLLAPAPARGSDSTLPDWAEAKATKVVEGLAGPMDFAFAPDGSVWFAELYEGNVTRLDLATGATEVKFHVEVVKAFDERGLVGLALDPDFARNGAFYIYYTKPTADPDGGVNRLSKVQDGKETVLLDGIPAFKRHNGGRILFANDGTMFVAVGDNEKGSPAQNLSSPLGKVLHLTRDGQPAAGNVQGLVHSLGHRNVYGLAAHPLTGELWATENSGWRRDEVNRIEPGKNYGYPMCEGYHLSGKDAPCPPQYTPPLLSFYENKTAAPTGAAWFLGQFVWASWNEGSLHHLWVADYDKTWKDKVVYDAPGAMRIADVEVSPDGRALWFSTWSELWRVEFPSLPPGAERPFLRAPPPVPTGVGSLDATSNAPAPAPRGLPGPELALVLAGVAVMALRRRR